MYEQKINYFAFTLLNKVEFARILRLLTYILLIIIWRYMFKILTGDTSFSLNLNIFYLFRIKLTNNILTTVNITLLIQRH